MPETKIIKHYIIKLIYQDKTLLELPAEAESEEDLREQYIKMFTKASFTENMDIKVYRKDANGDLHLVAEHLF